LGDGVLYSFASPGTGAQHSRFQAVDPGKGTVLWSLDLDTRPAGTPVAAKGFAYVIGDFTQLVAIDLNARRQTWEFHDMEPGPTAEPVYGCPVLAGDSLYWVSPTGSVGSVQTSSGRGQWITKAPGRFSEVSGVAVADGSVYTASTDGVLTALDASSGQQRWSSQGVGDALGTPVVAQGVVYVASRGGLTAVNAADGRSAWSVKEAEGGGYAQVCLADRVVYVPGGTGTLRAVAF
jgi:outer membrane protein assembly factor BamB